MGGAVDDGTNGRIASMTSIVVRGAVAQLAMSSHVFTMSLHDVLQLRADIALTNHRSSVPTQRATCRIAESV
jgi:hypothetical protein